MKAPGLRARFPQPHAAGEPLTDNALPGLRKRSDATMTGSEMKGDITRARPTLRARQAASFLAAMAITSATADMASMSAGAWSSR